MSSMDRLDLVVVLLILSFSDVLDATARVALLIYQTTFLSVKLVEIRCLSKEREFLVHRWWDVGRMMEAEFRRSVFFK